MHPLPDKFNVPDERCDYPPERPFEIDHLLFYHLCSDWFLCARVLNECDDRGRRYITGTEWLVAPPPVLSGAEGLLVWVPLWKTDPPTKKERRAGGICRRCHAGFTRQMTAYFNETGALVGAKPRYYF